MDRGRDGWSEGLVRGWTGWEGGVAGDTGRWRDESMMQEERGGWRGKWVEGRSGE